MPEISQQTQKLIQQYKSWQNSLQKKEGTATIHVDEVASRVAAFYEKIRGVIDWREEHLLRRGAIERILKRRLFLRAGQQMEAQNFVLELIRGGHFPNDKIEEAKIGEIQKALNKYVYIIEKSPIPKKEGTRLHLQDWMSCIAACEVEEILDPARKERILIDYMAEQMGQKIKIKSDLSDEEKNAQVFIAVQKALFKLDTAMISYHLLKKQFPQWMALSATMPENGLAEITNNIYLIWKDIEKKLRHPFSERFYRICERYDTPYLILGDILSHDPARAQEKLDNPESFESEIKKFYQMRQKKQKSRVFRAAIYSVLSIFITKLLVAFFLEYQIDMKILHQFSNKAMLINVVIPPFIMLLFILGIKPPSKRNLDKVIMETMKIAYTNKQEDYYSIKSFYYKNPIMKGIIFVFYLMTFFITFFVIWFGLELLEFSWPSKIIFIIFLSLISFAGTKIKERAKELSVEDDKGGVFGFIADWFSLPFITLGKWLSGQWSKYNTIVVMFIALLDLPFLVFIEFLEQWRYFIKEKKEEIH